MRSLADAPWLMRAGMMGDVLARSGAMVPCLLDALPASGTVAGLRPNAWGPATPTLRRTPGPFGREPVN